jgi:beta-xylosidase
MGDRPATSQPKTYTNPVYNGYHADPFAWRHQDMYYSVGTGGPEAIDQAKAPMVIPLLRSRDLVQWEYVHNCLRHPDPRLGDAIWAPETAYANGTHYLYYSVGHGDREHQLRAATSPRPEGPYADIGRPLLVADPLPFVIDPHAFRDDDGQWYLFYAHDFLDSTGGARPGTALAMDRLLDMTTLAGEEHVIMRARFDWQLFLAARPMYGRTFDWHTLEGPFVRKHAGKYYCLYSGGRWESDNYGVDYGVADRVTGPYDTSGGRDGPRVLRTVPDRVLGPGHNSIVTGPDGRSDYIVYHAWDTGRSGRRMCIDRLTWTTDGPRCDGPTTTPQPAPAGSNR